VSVGYYGAPSGYGGLASFGGSNGYFGGGGYGSGAFFAPQPPQFKAVQPQLQTGRGGEEADHWHGGSAPVDTYLSEAAAHARQFFGSAVDSLQQLRMAALHRGMDAPCETAQLAAPALQPLRDEHAPGCTCYFCTHSSST